MPASAEPTLLFVYGTLMRGEPAHRLLARGATFVGDGDVRGRLLDLGRFPGLVGGAGRVRGEVWRLPGPEVLRTLDKYEGYNFERRRTIATLGDARRVRAWVYRYRGPRAPDALPARSTRHEIPEGHWRRHRWR